jgi:hypothetical protein
MNEKDAVRRPQSRFAAGVMPLPITMADDPAPTPAASGVDAVLNERGQRYGKFIDHAGISQRLKSVMKRGMGRDKWKSLRSDQKEAIEMICHKLARVANGDPDYADSWMDIAGYSKLVADRLEGVER